MKTCLDCGAHPPRHNKSHLCFECEMERKRRMPRKAHHRGEVFEPDVLVRVQPSEFQSRVITVWHQTYEVVWDGT